MVGFFFCVHSDFSPNIILNLLALFLKQGATHRHWSLLGVWDQFYSMCSAAHLSPYRPLKYLTEQQWQSCGGSGDGDGFISLDDIFSFYIRRKCLDS